MYDSIRSIIKNDAILNNFNSSQNSFIIKELDVLAKCNKVELIGFENEATTICFELDSKNKNLKCNRLNKLSPYFKDGIDLDKGNDAIIFTKIDSKDYIFICELKDDSNHRELIKQFKSSTCFLDYLKSILKNIYNKNVDCVSVKYLVFCKHGNNLKPTGNCRNVPKVIGGLPIFFKNCSLKHNIKSFL